MSVYVDNPIIPWKGKLWAHMAADTVEELHLMADKIGLKREYFQGKASHPHYDVTEGMRMKAIVNGAIAVRSVLMAIKGYPKGRTA